MSKVRSSRSVPIAPAPQELTAELKVRLPARSVLEPQFWLALLCGASLLAGPVAFAKDGDADPPSEVAATQDGHQVEALLNQIEQQIDSGHTMTPESDNALVTWRHVLETAPLSSPEARKALVIFAKHAQQRANDERAAGNALIASDFSVFADVIDSLLDQGHATQAGVADVPNGNDANIPLANLPAEPATPAESAAGNANGTASVETSAQPQRSETTAPPMQVAHGDATADVGASLSPDTGAGQAAKPIDRSQTTAMPAMTPSITAGRRNAPDQAAAAAFASRGDAMVAIKDISAARKYYEYAANAGSARAALALGETYDPAFLSRLGAVGLKPNPLIAADWYRKAASLGDHVADGRLQALAVGPPKQ